MGGPLLCLGQQIDCRILRNFSVFCVDLEVSQLLVFVPLCKLCMACLKHCNLLGTQGIQFTFRCMKSEDLRWKCWVDKLSCDHRNEIFSVLLSLPEQWTYPGCV